MNELKFAEMKDYLEACYYFAERGANFCGWEDSGWWYIEIRGV